MKLAIADTFDQSIDKLSKSEKLAAYETTSKLRQDLRSNSLRLHRLERARDKDMWSVRVNKDIRIILQKAGDWITLCYVDHHDDAYSWAERNRLAVHPETGAMQLVHYFDTETIIREEPGSAVHDHWAVENAPTGLFDRLSDSQLMGVGLPEELTASIRRVFNENDFYNLIDFLPTEASEALAEYLETGSLPPKIKPTKESRKNPFEHPDSRRRFRIVENEEDLRRAVLGDWNEWRIYLHPTQQEAVERSYSGPARVTGAAGTGKTIVALHRAFRLAKEDRTHRVLLTTFSNTLAARMRESMQILAGPNSSVANQVTIINLHAFAHNLLRTEQGKNISRSDEPERNALFRHVLANLGTDSAGADSCIAEWNNLVNEEGIRTWEDYRKVSRAGRGKAMNLGQRQHMWQVLEMMTDALTQTGKLTTQDMCRKAANVVSAKGSQFTHVIADEVQDFGPAELRLLKVLSEPNYQLFLTGDLGQRIYKGKTSFRAAGIELRGRSLRLKVNYRTTAQIRSFADSFMPSQLADPDDPEASSRLSISLLKGKHPETTFCTGIEKEVASTVQWLKSMLSMGYKAADIAILARTKKILEDRARQVAGRLGLKHYLISNDSPPSTGHLAFGTMHNSKGLEFKVVVLMGVEDRYLPNQYVLGLQPDEADKEAFIEQERNLLYVAATRARERLLITAAKEPSRFLVQK